MICSLLKRLTSLYIQICLIILEGVFEGLKYFKTYKNDLETNSQSAQIYDVEKKTFLKAKWMDIKVGHIIKVLKDEIVPADIILIETLDQNHTCAVDESSINGIFDMFKIKTACVDAQVASKKVKFNEYVKNIKGVLRFEDPNGDIQSFHGRLKLESYPRADDVKLDNFIMRGSSIKNIKHVYGIVVYTGMETKIMQILKQDNAKSVLEKKKNKTTIVLNVISLILMAIYSALSLLICLNFIHRVYKVTTQNHGEYLGLETTKLGDEVFYSMVEFLAVFQLIFPFTWINMMFVCYYILQKFLQWDVKIKLKNKNVIDVINPKSLPDFGNVRYILTDKTGTLTMRKFVVKGISVKGKLFTFDPLDRKDDNYIFKGGDVLDIDKEINTELSTKNQMSVFLNEFFEAMSVCHNAMLKYSKEIEDKSERIPGSVFAEEKAVLRMLKRFGYTLCKTKRDKIVVRINEELKQFNYLGKNEFTESRQRMSVVIKNNEKEGGCIINRIYFTR